MSTRRRLALAALAAGGAVALVVTLLASRPSQPVTPPRYQPLTVDTTSGAQGVTSIHVTVESPDSGSSLQIQVLRSIAASPADAIQESPADQQVVFQEQVPMTDVASPVSGPPGPVARATWSGVLTPNQWTGGCQNSLYRIVANVADPSGTYSSFSNPAHIFKGKFFNCSSG